MPTAPRFRTVLFDLDGTLIDSIRLILDSYHHTLAAFGMAPKADAELLAEIGTPLSVTFASWASGDRTVKALIETYRAYNLEQHDARVRAYPGVVAAVRALAGAGVRLGLVTSKNRQGALRGLGVAGLVDAMEILICSEDVIHPKPHREPVDRAVALLDGDRRSTIFIGDSLHDMRSGKAAEVATGAALWGPFSRAELEPSEPRHWLRAPDDVVRLVLGG
jgi:pyrophosphatase PpaX